jgi:iron complex transport system ATP-binding protein
MRKKIREIQAVLHVENLGVRRGDTQILRDVNWRVLPGEHWVILGANGSGKTSLLTALTGYLTPTRGEIHLLGERYGSSDWRALRKSVGLVSSSIRQMMAESEPALETVVSGKFAMIDFWGRPSPVDRRRGLAILRQIEGVKLAERPWAYLSQGERQRVLIGRALMGRPKVLILDEPCAGLDPAAREGFLNFLQRLAKKPKAPSLILVTHHVEEIMPGFNRVLVLKDGEVLAHGSKDQVLTGKVLGAAFQVNVRVSKQKGRYALAVKSNSRGIV